MASRPHQGDVVREALGVEVDGGPLFTVVQSTWNLLEPSAGPALAEAAEAGWSVVVKEALATGRLAPGGDDDARVIAAAAGVPLDQLALAAALAQPWADRVLSGAVTSEQVASNTAAASVVVDADVHHRLTALAEDPTSYWLERSARAWQ